MWNGREEDPTVAGHMSLPVMDECVPGEVSTPCILCSKEWNCCRAVEEYHALRALTTVQRVFLQANCVIEIKTFMDGLGRGAI